MISRELAKKIQYIQFTTKRAVNSTLAGEYESVFKGQGIEFEEVREYLPGDDIRAIDWNVTARTGVPHVKRFTEERELTVLLCVDLSASGSFGSTGKTKNEIAAEICALLAFSAIQNNDRVGLIVFTDSVEHYVPPKKGNRHVLRLIEEILNFQPSGSGTKITAVLDYMGRVTTKKAVIFLISDFYDSGYEHRLKTLGKRHDCISIIIEDPAEKEIPVSGLLDIIDAETGEHIIVDTDNSGIRRSYFSYASERRGSLIRFFTSSGIDHIYIQSDADYVKNIVQFFLSRERRLRI